MSSVFQVPKKFHFELIGKGGATVKRISQTHKVRINIPRNEDTSNGIEVSGKPDDVEQVRLEFERVLGLSVTTQALQKIAFDVAKPKHGVLIGPKGATIRQLEKDSGCSFNIPRPGDGNSLIEVEGSANSIEKAKKLVAQLLGSAPRVVDAPAVSEKKEAPVFSVDLTQPLNEVLFFPDKNMTDGWNFDRFLGFLSVPTKTMDVCVFTITDDRITRTLMQLHRQGVRVRIITDNECAKQQGSDVQHIAEVGIPIKVDKSEFHMHNKFAIMDNKLVLNGSFNWTTTASSVNHENVIISNNADLVNQFAKHFEDLWNSDEFVDVKSL